MDSGGCKGDDFVANFGFAVVDHLFLIHDTNSETSKVVFLNGHHTGVLGGLATDQRSAGLNAAFGNSAYDFGDLLRNVFAAGNIVKEEQRLCTAADDIVDTHGNGIDTDGVMLIH